MVAMRADVWAAKLAGVTASWMVAKMDCLKAVPSAEMKAELSAANWAEQMDAITAEWTADLTGAAMGEWKVATKAVSKAAVTPVKRVDTLVRVLLWVANSADVWVAKSAVYTSRV